ncbi:AraC family transcriptional regulator [Actinoplanes sp. NPDC026619]|uniref:AraC family transcriptional regulator n=1 Tax=Actinoplanes sp. NPDC026619 TaxID=3155798 RepID=UPI003402F755
MMLTAVDQLFTPADMLYEPMICFVAAGAKRTVSGDRSWLAGAGDMYLNSLHVPVTAVFEALPYRAAIMRLDTQVLTGLLLELDAPPSDESAPGQGTAPMPAALVDAVTRWVGLLDTPSDIRPLAARIESEILYRLLQTPLGPVLRRWSVAGTAATRIRHAAAWLLEHYATSITVAGLAAVAHMSPATLHRHFRAATGMSPLQFQKHLRLQQARRLLVAGDTTAAQVALAVGYASATQFNREYRRVYGLPPAQDAVRLRVSMGAAR